MAACVLLSAALVGGVALGLANPSLGCFADKYHISKFSTFGIFIISGLTLRSQEIGAAAEAWLVGLFGLLAGGNSALALAMTLISSLLGILIVPFTISKFIAAGVGVSFPAKQLFRSLILTLLVPLLLGKVAVFGWRLVIHRAAVVFRLVVVGGVTVIEGVAVEI
ncbi:hypothetical protein RJ640_001405 [Escallonia rubra]|uniref:Uncharacterized protein n=1 Tax=Escallonia rubra TaxID=112253 RepID=A0AA88UG35_9ASTE|nr:hypothetical protein RJ640_001405 [Escallonia rubra]